MSSRNDKWISPKEIAEEMGLKDPETIRAALRAGTFPVGWAAHIPGGRWKYMVPRKAWDYFCQTGRVPDVEITSSVPLKGDDSEILRAAAAICFKLADTLEETTKTA